MDIFFIPGLMNRILKFYGEVTLKTLKDLHSINFVLYQLLKALN